MSCVDVRQRAVEACGEHERGATMWEGHIAQPPHEGVVVTSTAAIAYHGCGSHFAAGLHKRRVPAVAASCHVGELANVQTALADECSEEPARREHIELARDRVPNERERAVVQGCRQRAA